MDLQKGNRYKRKNLKKVMWNNNKKTCKTTKLKIFWITGRKKASWSENAEINANMTGHWTGIIQNFLVYKNTKQ